MNPDSSSATKSAFDEFRCPTCGARQSWADVCRRCKCDLSLVVAGHRRRRRLRDEYLIQLRRQRADEAVRAANELHALAPDDESLRLRAVAHLLRGDFAAALQDAATAWHGLPTKRDDAPDVACRQAELGPETENVISCEPQPSMETP